MTQQAAIAGWTREQMARRLAQDIPSGSYVNLGIGIPELVARFVLNRCAARTVIARETALTLADHDPPLLASKIGQRVAFAEAAQSGRLVWEAHTASPAAREITALAAEVGRLAR